MTVSASSDSDERSTPSTVIDPLSGRSSPAIRLSSVDLPIPDSPTIATNSPRSIENVIDSKTRLGRGPAKVFVRLATSITARRLLTPRDQRNIEGDGVLGGRAGMFGVGFAHRPNIAHDIAQRSDDGIVLAFAQVQKLQQRFGARLPPQAYVVGRGRFQREVFAHQRDTHAGDHE